MVAAGMEQSLKQTQRLEHKLNMTQEMRLSIELLQKNIQDLREFLIEEISANPYLEVEEWGDEYSDENVASVDGDLRKNQDTEDSADTYEDPASLKTEDSYSNMSDILADFDWNTVKENSGNSFGDTHVRKKNDYDSAFSFEDVVAEEKSFTQKLDIQVSSMNVSPDIKEIMIYMVYNLDEKGFLRESDEDMAETMGVDVKDVAEARENLRHIEPEGIGCRDLMDYFKLKFSNPDNFDADEDTIAKIQELATSEELLELLVKKDFDKLCKALGVVKSELLSVLSAMRCISPFPSFGYENFVQENILPDLRVYLMNNEVIIELDNKFLPTVKLNKEIFDEELKQISDKNEKEFMKERYRNAEWIVKSLSERNRTLYEVAASIFTFQRQFLEFGDDFLKSLTLKDVAGEINRHQSTVSRLTNGKYAVTPHGIYELKSFFVKKVNENVPTTNRHLESKIQEILDMEDKTMPLSDEDITRLLSKEGIDVARRTVAKYRAKMKIPSARERKRDHEFSVGG